MTAAATLRASRAALSLSWIAALAACVRPAQGRAESDTTIGQGRAGDVDVSTPGAHILDAGAGSLELWGDVPVVDVTLTSAAPTDLVVSMDNCMPGARARVLAGDAVVTARDTTRPTRCTFDVALNGGPVTLQIAPDDAGDVEPFRVAVMGDIQTALDRVTDVFDVIAEDPSIRFVISTGDIVEDNRAAEYQEFLDALESLPVPYFSTIGNHELRGDVGRWAEYFGRYNIHFEFKGAYFTFVDDGNATIDPLVYDWLDGWLDEGQDAVHVFGQHIPALDPSGLRNGAMRSRSEAAFLLHELRAGRVDVTFYGHIHTYEAFDNAGIPAYISGGGGALPERLDGIGRHFLSVDIDPAAPAVSRVGVVRVDE